MTDERIELIERILWLSKVRPYTVLKLAAISRQVRFNWKEGLAKPGRTAVCRVAIASALLNTRRPDLVAARLKEEIDRMLKDVQNA